jgi:hypothetical protein
MAAPHTEWLRIQPSFERVMHAFADRGWILVDGERYGALESVPAGNEYAESAIERSAAIHPSYGVLACLQPAATAASIRSRRLLGIPPMSKTVSGITA